MRNLVFSLFCSGIALTSTAAVAGVLDPSFGTGGKVITGFGSYNAAADALALAPNGQIVAAGSIDNGATNTLAVVRYNADGSLDTSFASGGLANMALGSDDSFRAVAVQPDGKPVAAGYSFNGSNYVFALARWNSDGSLDTSFDGDGVVTTNVGPGDSLALAMALQPDGKIVAAGTAFDGSNFGFAVVRYNADGSLDTSFDGDGTVITAIGSGDADAFGSAIQGDGKLVLAGFANDGTNYVFALARYNPDGSLDTSFDGDGKVTTQVGSDWAFGQALAVQPDGKLVAGGYTQSPSNTDIAFALVRYNIDGSLDSSFDGDGKVITPVGVAGELSAVAAQADGKLVAVGYQAVGNSDFDVVRYNPDGSLDTSFNGDGKVVTALGDVGLASATSVAVRPGGNLVVGGLANMNGHYNFGLVGYLAHCGDGVVDAGEQCDDGNVIDGDCCSSDCQAEPAGNACADDGEVCTVDHCDGAGACAHPAGNAGATCRASASVCDVAEVCDGVSPACPADGFVADGTSCSDGAFCNGAETCQSGACQPGTAPCAGTCDEAGDVCTSCPTVPRTDCLTAARSVIRITKNAVPARNKLVWKWVRGESTNEAELADPRTTATYSLCLYDGAGPPATQLVLPPDAAKWTALGAGQDQGFGYKDTAAAVSGLQSIVLRTSASDRSTAVVVGRGAALPNVSLPLALPLKVQLYNSATGVCWSAEASSATRNDMTAFKAVAP